jgi:ABC-type transport system involved in cytochrome bd biosynthesis fused ATPase/permease subunit
LSTYHRIITGGRPGLPAGSSRPQPALTSKITISGWSTNLRNQVAILLKEPLLFSTSVGENIAYARPDASFDEIVAAAAAVGADEFISVLL